MTTEQDVRRVRPERNPWLNPRFERAMAVLGWLGLGFAATVFALYGIGWWLR